MDRLGSPWAWDRPNPGYSHNPPREAVGAVSFCYFSLNATWGWGSWGDPSNPSPMSNPGLGFRTRIRLGFDPDSTWVGIPPGYSWVPPEVPHPGGYPRVLSPVVPPRVSPGYSQGSLLGYPPGPPQSHLQGWPPSADPSADPLRDPLGLTIRPRGWRPLALGAYGLIPNLGGGFGRFTLKSREEQ